MARPCCAVPGMRALSLSCAAHTEARSRSSSLPEPQGTLTNALSLLSTPRLSAATSVCTGAVPEATPEERSSTVFRSGNERLYEAYNDLHSLAQDFEKPFDAPAILVVGHQTDGKSGGDAATPGCCGAGVEPLQKHSSSACQL
jgi:hypothetical protein